MDPIIQRAKRLFRNFGTTVKQIRKKPEKYPESIYREERLNLHQVCLTQRPLGNLDLEFSKLLAYLNV